MGWAVTRVYVRHNDEMSQRHLDELLADGWEPFTVTPWNGESGTYHLRKEVNG